MSKQRILLQLDTDPQPSVFDAVVAIDAGAEHLLRHGGVTPENVQALIHGAMFTRGPDDLRYTAAFVGGSDVARAEAVVAKLVGSFFGPLRVSVLMDANGCNTTAAAAVLAAARHVDLSQAHCLVLGGTGPVGQRAARLLAREGAQVRVASRQLDRAQRVCGNVAARVPGAQLTPLAMSDDRAAVAALADVQVAIAAGAAGVELLSAAVRSAAGKLRVAIDLNAVPPAGIAGVQATDKAKERDGVLCYGAIGVGGTKMKIHKAAIARLFERNDQVLDAEEMLAIGKELAG